MKLKMQEKNAKIDNLIGKSVSRPTLKMIFILMRSVDLVSIEMGNEVQFIITNLTENHKKILRFLGPEFIEMYDF
jgi:hypothetical protein